MTEKDPTEKSEWFAVRTRQAFKAESLLAEDCEEVFFPKEEVVTPERKKRVRAAIPHVLFIRTTRSNALRLEAEGRRNPGLAVPIWIYRYPDNDQIQVIPRTSIDLLRLLTADETTRCRIYTVKDFSKGQRVRVTGGLFKGYEGYVRRVEKNRHVVVSIEGICMVLLPFIHPDLLERID